MSEPMDKLFLWRDVQLQDSEELVTIAAVGLHAHDARGRVAERLGYDDTALDAQPEVFSGGAVILNVEEE